MTPVAVPEQTGELARRWLIATVAAAVVAATIPIVAGGTWDLVARRDGGHHVVGFTLAAHIAGPSRSPSSLPCCRCMTVPDTAPVDRAIVALPTAIAVLVAIECAVVTRRLDTAAPVSPSGHDPAVIVATVAAAGSPASSSPPRPARPVRVAGPRRRRHGRARRPRPDRPRPVGADESTD